MSLTVCSLASGSSGNCTFVASARTAILIDAGLSRRQTARRLAAIGRDLAEIRAICLTHEHEDHMSGLPSLLRGTDLAVYANQGTLEGLLRRAPALASVPWHVFTTGYGFAVDDLEIRPFAVPHDTYEPVGFVVACGGCSLGVVTDMGLPTGLIRDHLRACRVVLVEANHDEQLLREAARPWPVKQRIASRQGHASNRDAARMVAEIAGPHLDTVFLSHLSAECNRPELALRAVTEALASGGHHHVRVRIALADRVSEVWTADR